MTFPRKHIYTEDVAKARVRQRTLNLVTEGRIPFLWDRQNSWLREPWAETCGYSDSTFDLLRRRKVLPPEDQLYIGMNGPGDDPDPTISLDIIAQNRALYGETQGRWVHGNVKDVLPQIDRAGVIVVDIFRSVGHAGLAGWVNGFFEYARQQADQIGACLLVTNLIKRGSAALTVEAGIEEWLEILREQTGGEGQLEEYRNDRPGAGGWSMLVSRSLLRG